MIALIFWFIKIIVAFYIAWFIFVGVISLLTGFISSSDYNYSPPKIINEDDSESEFCACGNYKMPNSDFCKDCI